MAIRANYLAFKDRVMRWLVGEDALFLVTGKADFRLCAFVLNFVMRRM